MLNLRILFFYEGNEERFCYWNGWCQVMRADGYGLLGHCSFIAYNTVSAPVFCVIQVYICITEH